jgi:hypothetical protein
MAEGILPSTAETEDRVSSAGISNTPLNPLLYIRNDLEAPKKRRE